MNKNIVKMLLLVFMLPSSIAFAQASEMVRVAVASNFLATLKSLSRQFTEQSGIEVQISNGATGMLYAQIKRGAPYDLFFAADAKRPQKLEKEGLIESGSRFTYVTGKLVAWSPNTQKVSPDLSKLDPTRASLHFVAIANPKTAPYGNAAVAVLKHYGLYDALKKENKIVLGENIGKTFHYVVSGNAQLGLVAKSYVSNPLKPVRGKYVEIPESLYPKLAQQAVILKGHHSKAVQTFLAFLKSAPAQQKIQVYGYGLGD